MSYERIDEEDRLDNDPDWESARNIAEAHLDAIQDDLGEEVYARELQRLTRSEYERLHKQGQDELDFINSLSPEDRATYYEWDGKKPPTDADYQVTE